MDKKIKLLAMMVITLGLSSCGDLFTKDKGDSSTRLNQALTCQADFKEFANIMTNDIKAPILCLRDQLHQFINFVKTDRPGYVSEKTLVRFLRSGAVDMGGEDIIPLLSSIFDLTHVIVGGQRGYVSRTDLDSLIDFLILFNENMNPVYKEFVSDDVDVSYTDYKRRKATIDIHLGTIYRGLSKLLRKNRTTLDQIDINKFLDSFFSEDLLTSEKIKSLLFLKKVFIGGNKNYLTYLELDSALSKISKLGVVAYDLIKLNTFQFGNEPINLIQAYRDDIEYIKEILHYSESSNEVLFGLEDILKVLNIYEIDTFGIEVTKYLTEMRILKGILIGRNGGVNVLASEFHKLINHLEFISDQTHFFYRAYTSHEDLLERPSRLTMRFSRLTPTSYERQFLDNFSRIVHDYKFFKGSNSSAVFNHEFKRNPGGIVEISIIEYMATLVMKQYGKADSRARGGYHMTVVQTQNIISDLRFLLKDMGIIKVGRRGADGKINGEQSSIGATENFVLMSTLFQYQSDGCNNDKVCMEIPEITEFLVGLVTSLSVKDSFSETMESLCGVGKEETFPVTCFRKNFVKAMNTTIKGDTKSLADYMPSFSLYLNKIRGSSDVNADPSSSDSYNLFLNEMESFTRTCNVKSTGESIKMNRNDAFGVFAGLLNLESTLLRFDSDKDGKLDGVRGKNEVLDAYYKVYEGAIKALVKDQGGDLMTKLAKPIYKYLVKYGKTPDTSQFKSVWQFIKFLLKFNKKADASRTTIATILKTLGEQSPTAKDYPFDCDECIERDCSLDAGPYWDRSVYDSEAKNL